MDGTILGKKYDIINGEGGGGGKLTPATADTLGGIKIGSGLSVTEDGTASVNFPPAPEPYTAGDYVEIDENNVISVSTQQHPGEYDEVEYKFITVDTGSAPKVKIQKYVEGVLVSDTTYTEFQVNPAITIDNLFTFQYTSSYNWKYTLLVASEDHEAAYSQQWAWNQSVNYSEKFRVTTGLTDIVLKSNLQAVINAITGASDFANAQARLRAL